ncbi:UDP-N-acetylmuramyl-tripeptide synthetase [Candidatus Roizmanbacteria bacterium]|nr:UDP-N-acetylmuramyl-tripeptide synthetase [Candidatus Roizmanbacteria bacterium]
MIRKIKNIAHLINAFLANMYYHFPARDLIIIGVTGTDGKTTTTHMIYNVLKLAGKKVSMISSVYAIIAGAEFDTGFHVTTPDPWFLQKHIKKAVDAGEGYLVLEVTSHALDQQRIWGIPFTIGVITNVTNEHLDYHLRYEEYVATKLQLIQHAKVGVVNAEDQSHQFIKRSKDQKIKKNTNTVSYGLKSGDITLKNFPLTLSIPGQYNKYNALAAAASTMQLGIEKKIIQTALKRFTGVKGRMDEVKTDKSFRAIVDFAHTPNGLENALKTAKSMTKKRLIHVFGCAGLRDSTKRPIMGGISARYADVTIITEEDYRTENLATINKMIAEGYKKEVKGKKQHFIISDRQEAINKAISLAKAGDLVILTGKGHEQSLCRRKTEHPWSEYEAVAQALKLKIQNSK